MCFVNSCCCKANFTQNFGTHIAKMLNVANGPGPVRSSFGPAGPGTMPEPDRTLIIMLTQLFTRFPIDSDCTYHMELHT